MKRQIGFTLLELMVVMAIVGILMTMGWKMYDEHSRTNNRTDAIRATTAVALALTKFKTDNGSFIWLGGGGAANTVSAHHRYLPQIDVGTALSTPSSANDITCANRRGFRWSFANGQYESCRGFYFITVVVTDTDADGLNDFFTITTSVMPLLPQANDLVCNQFTLNSNGVRGHLAINDPDPAGDQPVADQAAVDLPNAAATASGQFHSTRRCWGSD